MARKPIERTNLRPSSPKIEKHLPGRHPIQPLMTPRERMWAAMLYHNRRGAWSVMDIEDLAHPIDRTSVTDYLESLKAANLAVQVDEQGREITGKFTSTQWRLSVTWPQAPRVNQEGRIITHGLGVLAMWRVARIRKRFTPSLLAQESTVGEVKVTTVTARKYCIALAKSGHFKVVTESKKVVGSGSTEREYVLVNDTGPLAPAITRAKVVFDRNTGALQHLQTPQEICDEMN